MDIYDKDESFTAQLFHSTTEGGAPVTANIGFMIPKTENILNEGKPLVYDYTNMLYASTYHLEFNENDTFYFKWMGKSYTIYLVYRPLSEPKRLSREDNGTIALTNNDNEVTGFNILVDDYPVTLSNLPNQTTEVEITCKHGGLLIGKKSKLHFYDKTEFLAPIVTTLTTMGRGSKFSLKILQRRVDRN
ncbi:hypothetical protein ACU680_16325 [Pseudomonas koreensis]